MGSFCFTVDDNIRCLKEITENNLPSIFDHPYLAMYKRLHKEFDLKVQLNLFYRMKDFDLSQVTDAHRDEWEANADWLKLSFHSELENPYPYKTSGYDEVYGDCKDVHDNILRFASAASLAKTTTVHCCLATEEGLQALTDHKVEGLLGLFGDDANPRTSYGIGEEDAEKIRHGAFVKKKEIHYGAIDIVLNSFSIESILSKLAQLNGRETIKVMIHEQFFYPDYRSYQPIFEDKLRATFGFLTDNGYKSTFFENLI